MPASEPYCAHGQPMCLRLTNYVFSNCGLYPGFAIGLVSIQPHWNYSGHMCLSCILFMQVSNAPPWSEQFWYPSKHVLTGCNGLRWKQTWETISQIQNSYFKCALLFKIFTRVKFNMYKMSSCTKKQIVVKVTPPQLMLLLWKREKRTL